MENENINIDDLLNSDLSPNIADDVLFSQVYKVLKGGFDLDGVETYLGSAKVGHLAKDIEIFELLTEDKSWPVSSIIQRDVDDNRVEKIANEFILKKHNNVKYFPPIVVAIVPRDKEEGISKNFELKETEGTEDNIKKLIFKNGSYAQALEQKFMSSVDRSTLDGFYVLNWLQDQAKDALCWDKKKVYAIVIDGQHRLQALKKAIKKKQEVAQYNQDIVFLDVSKRAHAEGRSPVEAIRRVFIDINYNAAQVTNARRTLMDDKDLSSLIVQTLVNDDDQSGEREGKFLVPQLVDWHSENLKHSFPQITGVLVLQQLIEDNFLSSDNLVSISDMRKSKKVSNFVQNLNSRFLVDQRIDSVTYYQGFKKLAESHQEFRDQIDKQTEEQDQEDFLFNMDYNVLNVARDTFEEIYASSVVKFFKEFLPYQLAIKMLEQKGVFTISNVLNRIIIKNPKKWTSNEREKITDLASEMRAELDSNYYLCFTVLGQKAFFRHYFKELVRKTESTDITKEIVEEFTTEWLLKMNSLLDRIKDTKFFSNDQQFKTDLKALGDYGVGGKNAHADHLKTV
jgi:DGQHR domain-containing protein